MRIATWNRPHQDCRDSWERLREWDPDVLAVQECSRSPDAEHHLWSGWLPNKGFAVVARPGWCVRVAIESPRSRSVRAFTVDTPRGGLNIIVAWAHREPSYVEGVLAGLDECRELLRSERAVMLGDFNSHPRFDDATVRHAQITDRLAADFSLVSAYHSFTGNGPGAETHPTYYHLWHEDKPFHLDYCFIPRSWAAAVRAVRVASFADFQGESDHRPMMVEIDDDAWAAP